MADASRNSGECHQSDQRRYDQHVLNDRLVHLIKRLLDGDAQRIVADLECA